MVLGLCLAKGFTGKMTDKLNTKEKLANLETVSHIQEVQSNLHKVIVALLERARVHDQSKLASPELKYFTDAAGKLEGLTYGTDAYNKNLEAIKPALEHHYAHNRHHPEHFANGVDDMNLVDLIEMICDWDASADRQNAGNVRLGIAKAIERFKISPQLASILKNTIDLLEH